MGDRRQPFRHAAGIDPLAGEHRSQDFQRYMEGGASEGVRAGQEVLAEL
jgi:monoamine oxidase